MRKFKSLARLKLQKTFSISEKLYNAVGLITALELKEHAKIADKEVQFVMI